MKKLFFTALVAIVAVGGACAQAYRFTPGAGPAEFYCLGPASPLCNTLGFPVYNLDGTPADEEAYNLHYIPAAF